MKGGLRKLERELAYSAARSDIECLLDIDEAASGHEIKGCWYRKSSMLPEAEEVLIPSLRYLELRKLLDVHPDNPDLVRPLFEKGGAS